MAGGAFVASGASTVGGMAHPLHLLPQNFRNCKGPLVASILRAIIYSYMSQFNAVNLSYILWFVATNVI